MTRLWVLAILLAAAGCGGDSGDAGGGAAAPGGADQLRGRDFVSTDVTAAGSPRPLAAGTTVSLHFTDDGRLVASAGCNQLQGPFRLTDGKLAVTDLSMTEMGCDPPRHEQDTWLAEFLRAAPTVRIDDTTLTLTSGDTEIVLLDGEVAQPDLALEGTRWLVDTLVDGETASSTPAGSAPAALRFTSGTVDVDTGCNTGSAPYTVDGATLTVGPLTLTRKACEPSTMQVEHAIVAALDGAATFEIDADRLTIDNPAGRGLRLRAES